MTACMDLPEQHNFKTEHTVCPKDSLSPSGSSKTAMVWV